MDVTFNSFSDLANALESVCGKIVSNTARAGKKHVQEHIQANGQVRTGYMLDSAYASTPEGSDYESGENSFPEAAPSDKTTAVFAVAATYAGFPNYGTRYQVARPFFEPGVDETKADFEQELGKLEEYLKAEAL